MEATNSLKTSMPGVDFFSNVIAHASNPQNYTTTVMDTHTHRTQNPQKQLGISRVSRSV
jgi:hypothetical protein